MHEDDRGRLGRSPLVPERLVANALSTPLPQLVDGATRVGSGHHEAERERQSEREYHRTTLRHSFPP
eukprot:scaffold315173_cov36-Tisochrysis_lutea.AAC.5